MQVGYLQEFLELVNYMNFTVAARKLNLTQSALSKHIAALEKEFDVLLVDRSKQQIELTQQGRIFCEEASRILDAYHGAYRRVHEVTSEIRVAGALRDSAIRYLISTTQDSLRDANESLRVVSREYPAGSLVEALIEKKIDLIIDVMHEGGYGDADFDIEECYLTSVPLVAVVKTGHHLAERTSVTLGELAREPIMHPTGSMEMQRGAQAIEDLFSARGVDMRKHIFFAQSWDDFPTADFGASVFVMPRSLFSRQLFGSAFSTFRGIPVADADARFPYRLAWRRGETHPIVRRYIEALCETGRRIDKED